MATLTLPLPSQHDREQGGGVDISAPPSPSRAARSNPRDSSAPPSPSVVSGRSIPHESSAPSSPSAIEVRSLPFSDSGAPSVHSTPMMPMHRSLEKEERGEERLGREEDD